MISLIIVQRGTHQVACKLRKLFRIRGYNSKKSHLLLKLPLEIAAKAELLFVACEPTCTFSGMRTFTSVGRQLRTSCSPSISIQLRVIKKQPCQMRLFCF